MLHGSFFISGFWYAAYQDASYGGSQVIDRTSSSGLVPIVGVRPSCGSGLVPLGSLFVPPWASGWVPKALQKDIQAALVA